MRKKVSIIGSGFTGTTTAYMIAEKELADVVIVDLPNQENPTIGKALDIKEASPLLRFDVNLKGTSDYQDTKDSDLVIITAGFPRKPGMSRNDLMRINSDIMKSVTEQIVKYSPNCIIIVLTNPVDIMTHTVLKASHFERNRVMGQSGILDTARFCTFVAEELNVSVKDVSGIVLGGHGNEMVPLISYASVGGIPVKQLISSEKLERIVDRTKNAGDEIVNLLGKGSAYFAPSASLLQMTEAILKDQRRLLPAIAYLDGEYGYHDICFGVPVILGSNGVEKIIELKLTDEEKKLLENSVNSVLNLIK